MLNHLIVLYIAWGGGGGGGQIVQVYIKYVIIINYRKLNE